MPLIRQLPVSMINKIAAGEVIERPASVVKELVENSVDAGATRIDIEVDRGGIELIRIVDNGCGIEPEQLSLAISSHATSKIAETQDLFQIRTFGFRGEALASIAEISQMVVRSRTPANHEGAEIRSDGGVFSQVAPCGHPVGTSIEIRNLFFNTPVRRKYLRSNQTELGHVTETFLRLALPHSNVHFTLKHNDRMLYDLPPTTNGIERIAKLFGKEVANDLIAIESHRGEVGVSGYVAHPNQSRSNNRLQYFFLNRRHIRDRALQHALTEAYRGLLTVGRFPIAFLHVEIPPDQVDVNVHPTKMEVRFLDSSKVYSHFLGAIRERFMSADLKSRPTLERPVSGHMASSTGQTSGQSTAQVTQRFGMPCDSVSSHDDDTPFGNATTQRGNMAARNAFDATQNAFDSSDPRTAMADQTAEQLRRQVLDWAKNIQTSDTTSDAASDATSDTTSGTMSGITSGMMLGNFATNDTATGNKTAEKSDFRLSRFAGMTGQHDTLGTGKSDRGVGDSAHAGRSDPPGFRLQLHELNSELLALTSHDDVSQQRSTLSKPTYVSATETTNGATVDAASFSASAAIAGDQLPGIVFSPIMQIHDRYIVTETDDGVAIIDQHAAHERVLYEKLKQRMALGTIESQRLLVPKPIDLPPNEAACALENQQLLTQLGLIVEPFGGDTILISGYPAIFPNCDPVEILQALLEPLMSVGKKPDRNDLLDEMMHQMSCKAAIKAGDKLRPEALAELLQLAHDEINSHHCPHGRPSTLVFTCQQLDKMFKRI